MTGDASQTGTTRPSATMGERRQVTVLFADMAGYTAMSERLGEEGAYALIQPIYAILAEAVQAQGGTIKDFTGDGIMALFGVPVALEDAPLRACRAALQIQERLARELDAIEARHGVRPQLRIGINTGAAIVGQVGDGAAAGVTAIGDTVNLASRLQALAEPGAVLLSEAVHRLVLGLADSVFAGERQIKGKAEPQKVYRLDGVREDATRFDSALRRGLTRYVGRDAELAVLERCWQEAAAATRVVDIVGDPGIGKSRLLHEFRQRLGGAQPVFLAGHCSPDGRQTAFLPFIEVLRASFRLSAGENETAVAQKLEAGLAELDLASPQGLALLLNLLGLRVPDSALAGMDGMVIGLRTRDLLVQLLQARCRRGRVALLLEDLHWIDNASEELLGKIAAMETLPLLIVHSRRPGYRPPWVGHDGVTTLTLEPLSDADTTRIVQARLGLDAVPAALARLIVDKAEGNALFAEEIAGFLMERGIVSAGPSGVAFGEEAIAAAMPASVQALLAARIDRLAPADRALLQTAAVIGRRFDPELLACVAERGGDVRARLVTLQGPDFVHEDGRSGDWLFKHALVRDALYASLLTGPRGELHLRIAAEIERRNDNRLSEVAQMLAHHYGRTSRADKAFAYAAMAAKKSLGIFSLEEAVSHGRAALSLLKAHPDCATDSALADLLADYSVVLQLQFEIRSQIETIDAWLHRLDRLGAHPSMVEILNHYANALLFSARYQDARVVQRRLSAMAETLGDARSRVFAFAVKVCVDMILEPRSAPEVAAESELLLASTSGVADFYPRIWLLCALGFDAIGRGYLQKTDAFARELIAGGQRTGDPRAVGLGLYMLGSNAMINDDYAGALAYSERGLRVAVTPMERLMASNNNAVALILLERLDEGYRQLVEVRRQHLENGRAFMLVATDPAWGVAQVLRGSFAKGIRIIKKAIAARERDGYRGAADWYRLILCHLYLEMLEARRRPPLGVLLRNLPCLLRVRLTAPREIDRMMRIVRANPQFDPEGFHHAKLNLVLGLRWKLAGRRDEAVRHLGEAKRLASPFGRTPTLARIEAALAELA